MKQTIKRHLNRRKYTRNLRKLRKKYTRNMRKATRNLLKKSRRFMNKTYKIQRGGTREGRRNEEKEVFDERLQKERAALIEASKNRRPPRPQRMGDPAVCELYVGVNQHGRVLPIHNNLRKQIGECLDREKINIDSGK